MAPFLIGSDSPVDSGFKVLPSQKTVKPFIPAIPRALERRHGRLSTSAVGSISDSIGLRQSRTENFQLVEKVAFNIPSTTEEPLAQGTLSQDLSKAEEDIGDGSVHLDQKITDTQKLSTVTEGPYKNNEDYHGIVHKQDFGIEKHGFQLPPAFYPSFPPLRTSFSPLHAPKHNPINIRALAFEGEPDSVQSSPTSLPSATSAKLTQPTPQSNNTPSTSQSLYQGYGHTYHDFGPQLPQKQYQIPQVPVDFLPEYACHSNLANPLPDLSQNVPITSPTHVFQQNSYSSPLIGSLSAYLSEQFNNPEYSDCRLDLEIRGERATLFLHSVLIAQSPTLRTLLGTSERGTEDGIRNIALSISDSFVTTSAMASAILYCYGRPSSKLDSSELAADDPFVQKASSMLNAITAQPLRDPLPSLALVAAGRILQVPEVAVAGVKSTVESLAFENLATVLSFAVNGVNLEQEVDGMFNDLDNGTYSPYALELMNGVLTFIAATFPTSFTLDVSASPITDLGGYPNARLSGSTILPFNPRLGSIHFGNFTPPTASQPSPAHGVLSQLLLSVGFPLLQLIFEHIPQTIARKTIPPIVKERERRRLALLSHGKDQISAEALKTDIFKRALWEERVVGKEEEIRIERIRTELPGCSN